MDPNAQTDQPEPIHFKACLTNTEQGNRVDQRLTAFERDFAGFVTVERSSAEDYYFSCNSIDVTVKGRVMGIQSDNLGRADLVDLYNLAVAERDGTAYEDE